MQLVLSSLFVAEYIYNNKIQILLYNHIYVLLLLIRHRLLQDALECNFLHLDLQRHMLEHLLGFFPDSMQLFKHVPPLAFKVRN